MDEASRDELRALGWDEHWAAAWAELNRPELQAARVASVVRGRDLLLGLGGEPPWAVRAGALHDEVGGTSPAVGDWVGARPADPPVVEAVLPRRSQLVRRAAGQPPRPQTIAANVDRVLVIVAAGRNLNLRRLERYAVSAWDGGVTPIVVVNKGDQLGEPEATRAEVAAAVPGVDVVVTRALAPSGLDELRPLLSPRQTVALVGSSGVGKSTLTNRLLGGERQAVQAVRAADEKGRHTTTRRELLQAPDGLLLIDTPGMREFGLWLDDEAALDETFPDVEALAAACRFRDCTHAHEPGCAVQAAVAAGELDRGRLRGWQRLQREAAFEARRRDPQQAANAKRRWRTIHRDMKRRRRED